MLSKSGRSESKKDKKSLSSKRYSLTRSRKLNIKNFLNTSLTHQDFNCNHISASTDTNPEQQVWKDKVVDRKMPKYYKQRRNHKNIWERILPLNNINATTDINKNNNKNKAKSHNRNTCDEQKNQEKSRNHKGKLGHKGQIDNAKVHKVNKPEAIK